MTESTEPAVDVEAMREARRRWASGVSVVLTHQDDGFRGATVAAFAVVSLEPPTVLICLDHEAWMSTLVPESGVFAVSILERGHEFLAERFAGRAPLVDLRLTGVGHVPAPSGLPVLTGALAWFDCRVRAVHDGGDHVVILGDVKHTGVGADTDDPLLYYEGRYRALEPGAGGR
jgi:3-hydroxy-9,10-secoandrosta-1,3,5(10)-triene-9,17-dione monooxygenase reductase component